MCEAATTTMMMYTGNFVTAVKTIFGLVSCRLCLRLGKNGRYQHLQDSTRMPLCAVSLGSSKFIGKVYIRLVERGLVKTQPSSGEDPTIQRPGCSPSHCVAAFGPAKDPVTWSLPDSTHWVGELYSGLDPTARLEPGWWQSLETWLQPTRRPSQC